MDEILNAYVSIKDSSGTKFLDLFDRNDSIQFSENTEFKFCVHVRQGVVPKLFIHDEEVVLKVNRSYKSSDNDELYESPLSQFFLNYMGYVEPIFFAGTQSYRCVVIQIFGSKMNYEQALDMMKFISSKGEDFSNICLSKVQFSGGNKSSDNIDVHAKLKSGADVCHYLMMHKVRFKSHPAIKVSSKSKVIPYKRGFRLDDRSIDYILTHPNVMSQSDAMAADIRIAGRYYMIHEVSGIVSVSDYDIYENQIIHGFLEVFYKLLMKIEKIEVKSNQNPMGSKIMLDGGNHYSIDSLLSAVGYSRPAAILMKVVELKNIVLGLKRFFDNFLPAKSQIASNVSVTPKIIGLSHYIKCFSLVKSFYSIKEPSWDGLRQSMFSIRSLSKIYEIYSLLRIMDVLKSNGYSIVEADYRKWTLANRDGGESVSYKDRTINEPNNFYKFASVDGQIITLTYEQIIYSEISGAKSGDLINVGANKGIAAFRTPDFIIRHFGLGSRDSICILDSKYTNTKQASSRYLPELSMKYAHGFRVFDGTVNSRRWRMVDSVVILYPLHDNEDAISAHSPDFSWKGNFVVSPTLCAIQLPSSGLGELLDFFSMTMLSSDDVAFKI